jgi:probable F420-dependent oxidoreductase
MRYGFTIPGSGRLTEPENMSAIAKRGEELGYHLLVVPDHVVFPRQNDSVYPYDEHGVHPGTGAGACLEQLTVLAFLAGQTRTIRLGTSVMIVPHRNPIVAAKALATLDVLSNGRVNVGVGAGWLREEFEALGLPPFDQRGEVTDEYIRAFKELWTSDEPSFQGKYCQFDNISFLPKPVQKPHPPIWVGGESNRALRRAARLGDVWHPLGTNPSFPLGTPQQLKAAIGRLAVLAEREGRDSGEIDVAFRVQGYQPSSNGGGSANREPFTGPLESIASDIRIYEDMGVSTLIVDFGGVASSGISDPVQVMQRMEEFATNVWPRV